MEITTNDERAGAARQIDIATNHAVALEQGHIRVESHTLWMFFRQKVEVVNNDAVARAGANDHVA